MSVSSPKDRIVTLRLLFPVPSHSWCILSLQHVISISDFSEGVRKAEPSCTTPARDHPIVELPPVEGF